LYEEFFYGSLEEARTHFTEQTVRGEFTLVVAGNSQRLLNETPAEERQDDQVWSSEKVLTALKQLSLQGLSLSQAAKRLAPSSGWARKDIYRLAFADRNKQEDDEVK
jgi:16S rRNA (cytidine1402-2'-O)-methyltransferase